MATKRPAEQTVKGTRPRDTGRSAGLDRASPRWPAEGMATRVLAGAWGGVELTTATYRMHRFPMHSHPETHIALVERGRYAFQRGGLSHVARTGDLVVMGPDDPHDGQAVDPDGYSYLQVLIPPALWSQITPEACGSHQWPSAPVLRSPVLARLIRRIFSAADAGGEPLDSALSQLTSQTVTHAEGGKCQHRAQSHLLRYAQDIMQAKFSEPLTLAHVSEATGVDRFLLYRMFRQSYGVGPHEWLVSLRLRHARRWLSAGTPPAEVSSRCGFADQSHLTRCFKKHYGITPGAFLRSCTFVQDRPNPHR